MKTLTNSQIEELSSKYITKEFKKESWNIESIKIENNKNLISLVSINSDYVSKNDKNKFHVSTFIINEFTSQIMVIFARYLEGDFNNSKEVWVMGVESEFIRSIYTKKNIKIEMELTKKKSYKNGTFLFFRSTIADNKGGLSKFYFKTKI